MSNNAWVFRGALPQPVIDLLKDTIDSSNKEDNIRVKKSLSMVALFGPRTAEDLKVLKDLRTGRITVSQIPQWKFAPTGQNE